MEGGRGGGGRLGGGGGSGLPDGWLKSVAETGTVEFLLSRFGLAVEGPQFHPASSLLSLWFSPSLITVL